jgi:hypothetical protein
MEDITPDSKITPLRDGDGTGKFLPPAMPNKAPILNGAWPRGLSHLQAAFYTGVGKTKFLNEVKDGLWPQPEIRGGRKIWDRYQLDEAWNRRHEDEGDMLMEALDDTEA